MRIQTCEAESHTPGKQVCRSPAAANIISYGMKALRIAASQTWWCWSVISATGKQRQEDADFKALGEQRELKANPGNLMRSFYKPFLKYAENRKLEMWLSGRPFALHAQDPRFNPFHRKSLF